MPLSFHLTSVVDDAMQEVEDPAGMEVVPGMAAVVEAAMVVAAAGVDAEVALATALGVEEAALGVDVGVVAASAAAVALGAAAAGVDMAVAAAGPRLTLPSRPAWAHPHPSMALTGTPLPCSLLGTWLLMSRKPVD